MAAEVIWFKRDLRLRDHPPLLQAIDSAALSGQSLLPIFFVEPERLKQPDTSEIHLHWELDCARALDRELQRRGSRLWILHADPLEIENAKKMLEESNGNVDAKTFQEKGCIVGVNNASFEVAKGEMLVVMGLSGSGK